MKDENDRARSVGRTLEANISFLGELGVRFRELAVFPKTPCQLESPRLGATAPERPPRPSPNESAVWSASHRGASRATRALASSPANDPAIVPALSGWLVAGFANECDQASPHQRTRQAGSARDGQMLFVHFDCSRGKLDK